MSFLRLATAVSLLVLSPLSVAPVHAQTAPMMLPAGDQALRQDLQWLIDRRIISMSVSTWPVSLTVIEKALEHRRKTNLERADVHALLSVRRALDDFRATRFGLEAHLNTDSAPQTAFAQQSRSRASLGLYGQYANDSVAGRLQVNGLNKPLTSKQSSVNLEGSYVATQFLGQVLYAGQLAHYWGPGQDGSINWGNAGTSIPGIGLQRAVQTAPETSWLSWIGPWGYEVFAGQMQHDTAVPDAKVFNARLFFQPITGLEIGFSRFMQWGGKGRDNSLGAWWKQVTGHSNHDISSNDTGNELAGLDFRYTLPFFRNPVSIYGQFAGEDEAGKMPSKFIGQLGVQYQYIVGNATRVQWHVEAADTMARRLFRSTSYGNPGIGYNHHVYRNGLYHDGMPIGHPIGGDARAYSIGLSVVPDDFRYHSRFNARFMVAKVNESSRTINHVFAQPAKWYGTDLSYSWRIRPASFSAGIRWLNRSSGHFNSNFSVLVSMHIPLGNP